MHLMIGFRKKGDMLTKMCSRTKNISLNDKFELLIKTLQAILQVKLYTLIKLLNNN